MTPTMRASRTVNYLKNEIEYIEEVIFNADTSVSTINLENTLIELEGRLEYAEMELELSQSI